MIELEPSVRQTIGDIEELREPQDKKVALIALIRELEPSDTNCAAFERILELAGGIENENEARAVLFELAATVPGRGAYLPLLSKTIEDQLDSIDHIPDSKHRKSAYNRLAELIPEKPEFRDHYRRLMASNIDACDKIDDLSIRRHSLLEIGKKLDERGSLEDLKLHAMKVALGLTGKPGYSTYPLEVIAKELPKSCDYTFYRKNTFLGIAGSLPRRGEFLTLYKQAIRIAMDAALKIEEPYYRKYALTFIADELKDSEEYLPLYKDALSGALDAAMDAQEPFTRQYALLELIRLIPKQKEFHPLLLRAIESALPFFSFKSRIDDVEAIDVIDYIIVAEERKLNESKKRRYRRESYAKIFAEELEKFAFGLDDIRFIEALKPYSHIWVRPVVLRDSIRKVLSHLSGLKKKYHGREIERPLFVKEEHGVQNKSALSSKDRYAGETLSIDLGATNTVIMRKRPDLQPEYVEIEGLSKNYGETITVPTLYDPDSKTIGTAGDGKLCPLNIKKLLLENSPIGRELMEGYFSGIFSRLKGKLGNAPLKSGWFARKSPALQGRLTVTVPVGFKEYKDALGEIVKRHADGMEFILVEEPLAAAIGYQVATEEDKLILVIDFGGCTLDVMLLRMNASELNVVAKPDRSTMLGGRDIDLWLAEYLAKKCGVLSAELPGELVDAAEKIKMALSEHTEAPFVWNGKEVCVVTRDDFEDVLDSHGFYKTVDRAISYVIKKAKKVGVSREMVASVLLTGGSSQIASFKEKISHAYPALREANAIYDHSPLSAVAKGAALYGTSDVIDRHLGVPYGVKYAMKGSEKLFGYEIVLESGDRLPIERTVKTTAAKTHGVQNEIFIELFEIPEAHVSRRWVSESGMEFIKQIPKQIEGVELKGFKVVTLPFEAPIEGEVYITFAVDEQGNLTVRYGPSEQEQGHRIRTEIRLQ